MTCWVGGSWQNLPSRTSVPRVAWSSCSKKYMKILKMFYHGRMASTIKSCCLFTCQWLFEDYPSVIFSGPEFWQGGTRKGETLILLQWTWDETLTTIGYSFQWTLRVSNGGKFADWINLTLQSTVECHQNTWLDFTNISGYVVAQCVILVMDHASHRHRSHNYYSRKHYQGDSVHHHRRRHHQQQHNNNDTMIIISSSSIINHYCMVIVIIVTCFLIASWWHQNVSMLSGTWDPRLCASGPLGKDQVHRGPPVVGSLGSSEGEQASQGFVVFVFPSLQRAVWYTMTCSLRPVYAMSN